MVHEVDKRTRLEDEVMDGLHQSLLRWEQEQQRSQNSQASQLPVSSSSAA